MEYAELVKRLSEKTGIDKDLFNLTFEKNNETGLCLINSQNSNSYYYSKYQYIQNSDYGGWMSISLDINNSVLREFLILLNEVLKELDEKLIDLENIPDQFDYVTDDKMFNILHGEKRGDCYRIDFARRK